MYEFESRLGHRFDIGNKNMNTASNFLIYKQLSDEEMTKRGYKIHIDKWQSEHVLWQKDVLINEQSSECYFIQIKESISKEGLYTISPSIFFENMTIDLDSLIDIDLDFIESLADKQSKLFVEHFWS